MNKYYIRYDRDSANTYISALEGRGYTRVGDYRDAHFYILDRNWREILPIMQYARKNHRRIFMIPHGSRGFMFWDSIYDDMDYDFTAYFLPAWGHKHVMYDYPAPIHVTGWPWCQVREFQPSKPGKVLFAPIHPDNYGKWTWAKRWHELNSLAWEKLVRLKDSVHLIVYHNWTAQDNGLTLEDGISYVESTLLMPDALAQIDRADLVIAQETFASLAIARGKPTIMIDDLEEPPMPLGKPSKYWTKYLSRAYPYNLLREQNTHVLFENATRFLTYEVQQWASNFVGDNFNKKFFVDTIEEYL